MKMKTRQTNFPKAGDDEKISLRNSNYPRFPLDFAIAMKDNTPKIWGAGGNIEGNRSFRLLRDHIENDNNSETILKKIKEREAWASRHIEDGNQFASGNKEPNLSNVGGIVAQIKWLVVNPKLGVQGMKDVILELTKKLEGRKDEDKEDEKDRQVSASVEKGIRNKVDQHNEQVKDSKKSWNPRVTFAKAEKVFLRGIGAYKTNPSSVRPNVSSPEMWAYARLNSYLFALRTGRFQGGKHDLDLLPEGHPFRSTEEKGIMNKINRHIQEIKEDEESVTIKFAKKHDDMEEREEDKEDKEKDTDEEKMEMDHEEEKGGHEEDEKTKAGHKEDEEKSYHDDDEKKASDEYSDSENEDEEDEDEDNNSQKEIAQKYYQLDSKKLYRSLNIAKKNIDEEKRTIEFSYMSAEPVERDFGMESIDVEKADTSFINSGNAPLLLDHDAKSQIGIIEGTKVVDGKGRAIARFGKSQLATEVFNDVKDGIRKNISVGYLIKEMDKVEDQDEEKSDGKDFFKVKIQPLEISMVSVPADVNVGIGRNLTSRITIKEDNMDKAKDVAKKVEVNPDEIRKAELGRIREIEAIATKHNKRDFGNEAIKSGVSVAEFKGLMLDKIGTDKPLENDPTSIGLSNKEQKRYSIAKSIRASLSNDWSSAGFEREVSKEIEKQSGRTARGFYVPGDVFKRDLTQGTATAGGHVTPDVHRGDLFIDALRGQSVVQQAGATIFRGLKGDIKIPRLTTKGTVGFVAENSAVSETNQAFDQVTMTERTLGGFVDLSRVLINNADPSIETIVRNDMTQQIGLKIDEVAFEGGGSNEPTGITQTSGIGDVAIGTNGGAITYDATIDMIKEVAQDNALAGSLSYAFTPEVVYQMRKTPKVSSTDSVMIMDNADQLNGYRVFQSSQLPKDLTKGSLSSTAHAGIFGNFADLLVGYYSGLDVLVDPYTGSSAGTVRLNFFTGMDVAVRHAESFCAILDIDETA